MQRYGLSFSLLLSLGLITQAHATSHMALAGQAQSKVAGKIVSFEKIKFSDQAKNTLKHRVMHSTLRNSNQVDGLPEQYNLGMHGLAPLDQGVHGSSVTFAVSGALNAATPAKNPNPNYFMSELCSLELGNYLHAKNSQYPSGWDGSWSTIVLRQVKSYGVVMMKYQRFPGCAEMTEYPKDDVDNKGNSMSEHEYRQLAQFPYPNLSWRSLYNLDQAITDNDEENPVITHIKQALVDGNGMGEGHRVLLAFSLDPSVANYGAAGTLKVANDSWVMTADIEKHAKEGRLYAGHEAIITGYDDNAEITGSDGTKHKGVFTVRSSWGNAGDNGDFYMSYDYLSKLSLDILELIP